MEIDLAAADLFVKNLLSTAPASLCATELGKSSQHGSSTITGSRSRGRPRPQLRTADAAPLRDYSGHGSGFVPRHVPLFRVKYDPVAKGGETYS
ncbi:hypothetical protein MY8738_008020 [Beauveria namnaoensis]